MGRKKANHRFKVYEHNQEASRLNKKLSDLKQLCRAEERKVRRLQDKINEQQMALGSARKRKAVSILPISNRKKCARLQNPSTAVPNTNGKLNIPERRACGRIGETMNFASLIHGGTKENKKPALDGLWCSLVRNCSSRELGNYVESTPNVMKKVIPPIIKKQIKKFEKSDANAARSLKVLYSGGLISKAKYKRMRSDAALNSNPTKTKSPLKTSMEFMEGVPVPKLLTYDQVQSFINTLDMGPVYNLQSTYGQGNRDEEINGVYRDLETLLLKIAKMYLVIDAKYYSAEKPLLNWFNREKGAFKVAIGADGAPFGKESEATAWLVSFLNVCTRVACPFDNFLLCGANCKEDHDVMVQFAKALTKEIQVIETKTYAIGSEQVLFSFELVPSDMKWLAFFSGELNNAAFYFSSFANVNQSNMETLNGTLGPESTNTWQPWDYKQRLSVAKDVEKFSKTLEHSTVTEKTKRTKVTNFIRSKKSRQQCEPLLGHLVDKALAEPLHNMNNAWQFFNSNLLNLVLDMSQIPDSVNSVKDLAANCPFLSYLMAIKEAKCLLLYKKLKTWFSVSRKTTFEFRFTGKESKAFCHYFMYLIAAVDSEPNESPSYQVKLHALAYFGLQLRDAVSQFSRQSVPQNYLADLKSNCRAVFHTAKMFLNHVNPTIWTIGYVIPYHASLTVSRFGLGLGINTMQGREAKHLHLQKHAKHSLTTTRWQQVFKHEFVTTLYLREIDANAYMYKHTNNSYIPKNANSDTVCYCGFPKQKRENNCKFCSNQIRIAVENSVQTGELDPYISQVFSGFR